MCQVSRNVLRRLHSLTTRSAVHLSHCKHPSAVRVPFAPARLALSSATVNATAFARRLSRPLCFHRQLLCDGHSDVLFRPFVSPLHLSVYVPVVSVCSFIRCFSMCCCACVSPPLRRSARTVAVVHFLCGAHLKMLLHRDGAGYLPAAGGTAASCRWTTGRLRFGCEGERLPALVSVPRGTCTRPLSVPPLPHPCLLVSLVRVRPVSVRAYRYSCAHRPSSDHPYSTPNVPPPFLVSGDTERCLSRRPVAAASACSPPRACLFCLIVSRPRCALISSACTRLASPRRRPPPRVLRHRVAGAARPTLPSVFACPLPPPSPPTFHREGPIPLLSALILTIFHPTGRRRSPHAHLVCRTQAAQAHSVSLRLELARAAAGTGCHRTSICRWSYAVAGPSPPLVSFCYGPLARPPLLDDLSHTVTVARCAPPHRTAAAHGQSPVHRAPQPPRRPLPLSAAAAPRGSGCRSLVEQSK